MQKQEKIIQMFDQIAPTYDLANRVLSFGVDVKWRKSACKKVFSLCDKDKINILDVACGTADMLAIWREQAKIQNKTILSLKGVDPSKGMLDLARKKFKDIEFIQAKAQSLPLENNSVDILSIGYGIRNVLERKKALEEFSRVLKKEGFLLVLEFTKQEKGGFISFFRDFYLKKILPFIGGLISKNKAAYEYLPNSIDNFLGKDEFVFELKEAGFKLVEFKSFSFGVSSMFIAQK